MNENTWKNAFIEHNLKGIVSMSQIICFKTIEKLIDEKVSSEIIGIFILAK